jgi:stage V sporulation protein B
MFLLFKVLEKKCLSKTIEMAKVSAKGSFHLMWGLALSSIIAAIGIIILGRVLSEGEFGFYSIALIAPNIIGLFRDCGVPQATTRFTAKYRIENEEGKIKNILAAGFILEVCLGFVLFSLAFLVSGFLADSYQRPELTPLIQIATFTIFAGALQIFSQGVFAGYERMHFSSILLIIRSILKTALSLSLVFLGFGAIGAIIGHTIAVLITALIGVIFYFFIFYRNLKIDNFNLDLLTTIKKMFRYGLPIQLSYSINGFMLQFFLFILPFYYSDIIIGNYQMAVNFAVLVVFISEPIVTTLFPAFSKINAEKEPEKLGYVFQYSIKYSSLFVVPISILMISLSVPAVSVLFGSNYALTPLYLSLYLLIYLYTPFGRLSINNLLNSQGKTQVTFRLSVLGTILGLALGLYLIPGYGVLGLISAILASSIPGLIIGLWYIKKNFKATIHLSSSLKIIITSTLGGIITYFVTTYLPVSSWFKLIFGTLLFLSIYLTITPLIGAIDKKDVSYLKQASEGLGIIRYIFIIPLNLIEKYLIKK